MNKQKTQWLIILVLCFLVLFISSCTSQQSQSLDEYIDPSSISDQQQQTVATNTVQEINGVQTVTLSWGKFNYNPETITVEAGKPVKIIADLDRLQGCFQSFVVPELGINIYFDSTIPSYEFTPTEPGTYKFSCSMGMGKGVLIVT